MVMIGLLCIDGCVAQVDQLKQKQIYQAEANLPI
jgi:hypothetical protein